VTNHPVSGPVMQDFFHPKKTSGFKKERKKYVTVG